LKFRTSDIAPATLPGTIEQMLVRTVVTFYTWQVWE